MDDGQTTVIVVRVASLAMDNYALSTNIPPLLLSLINGDKRGSSGEDDIQRVDNPGNVPEDGQNDVEPELVGAPNFEKHPEGRKDDGKDDLGDIGTGNRLAG